MLQMHTTLIQPFTGTSNGSIVCHPIGEAPVIFVWYGPAGWQAITDSSGSQVLNITVGEYRVLATDASGRKADVGFVVKPITEDSIVVTSYNVSHTSTSLARDGAVEVLGENIEGVRFLWTNGMQTEGPILRDVSIGIYIAFPLSGQVGRQTCVHMCGPAYVQVRRD
jgi:hypothetical protein